MTASDLRELAVTSFERNRLRSRLRNQFDEQFMRLAFRAVIHDAANGFALCIHQSVPGDNSGSSLGPVEAPLGRASIVKAGHNLLAGVATLGKAHRAVAVVIEVLRQVAAGRLAFDACAPVFNLQPEWV